MGDRSNIVIENAYGTPSRVYLYGHWEGERIIKSAVHGLTSGRATDIDYLARVVFENMLVRSESIGTELGYGISARLGDNEHPVLVISDRPKTDEHEAGVVVYFETQPLWGEDFEVATKKIPYREFLTIIESIENWQDLTERNELYAPLMARMAE